MAVGGNPEIGLFFEGKQSKMNPDTRLHEGRWNMIVATMAEAKTNLSKLAAQANATGESVTVYKNKKPWIEICPLAYLGHSMTAAPAISEDAEVEGDALDDYSAYYHPVSDPLPPETLEALKGSDEMFAHPENYTWYTNPNEFFADLGLR